MATPTRVDSTKAILVESPLRLKTVLLCKDGYRQGGFSRGLLYITLAQDAVVRRRLPGVPARIVVTAGSNGSHSAHGPHYTPRYEANDVRTKGWPTSLEGKVAFMVSVMRELKDGPVTVSETRQGWPCAFTFHYYAVLEHHGKRREHLHFQVRRGKTISA